MEESTDAEATSETVLFLDKDRVEALIDSFSGIGSSINKNDNKETTTPLFEEWRSIFNRYLEAPTLLDPLLESWVKRLTCAAINQKDHHHRLNNNLSAIYILCKVRGYKVVQRFLPHSVDDILPVYTILKELEDQDDNTGEGISPAANPEAFHSSQEASPPRWESIYVMWHWIGALSLVPLDLQSMDDDFLNNILERGLRSIDNNTGGPVGTAAGVALARWCSRPDAGTQQQELVQRLERKIQSKSSAVVPSATSTTTELLGVLHVLCNLLKHNTQKNSAIVQLLEPLEEPLNQVVQQSSFLQAKLWMKFNARLCTARLPARIVSWRYQRGHRLLEENLKIMSSPNAKSDGENEVDGVQQQSSNTDTATVARNVISENISPNDTQDLFEVPDSVEDEVGRLLLGLGHGSSLVRWSAAKGLGRVVARLPLLCALDVVDAIVELLEENDEDEQIWHGGSLGLAELSRRGLLLPSSLHVAIPLLIRAIEFDVLRGSSSVGASVRDAACYTYWAMCRAYSPEVLSPFLASMTSVIVTTSLLDREVNCRRAASAAFQEAVGRQEIANGIAILTVADYYSLGNRHDAYTTIAHRVAQYGSYGIDLVKVLHTSKLFHWDINIRAVSSEALRVLTPLHPELMAQKVIPCLLPQALDPKFLNVRNGATLGLAETVLGLAQCGKLNLLADDALADLRALVPVMEKKRLYRGRGGEIMRSAVCRLVECMATAKINLTVPEQVRLLDSIDSSIPHPSSAISRTACQALQALLSEYFPVGDKGPSDRLRARVVDKFVATIVKESNPAATRGYALALGHVPAKLVACDRNVLKRVVSVLSQLALPSAKVGGACDAETRQNALEALSMVTKEVVSANIDAGTKAPLPLTGLDKELAGIILNAFFTSVGDYQIDRRGDVGSWCRVAAMNGLCEMVQLVPSSLFDEEVVPHTMAVFLKQLAEKIHTVRQCAGNCVTKLCLYAPLEGLVPHWNLLSETLKAVPNRTATSWSDESISFPFIAAVMRGTVDSSLYFSHIVEGLVLSAGGLTESTRHQSLTVLLDFCRKAENADDITKLTNCFVDMYEEYVGKGRVALPLLKTVDQLATRQCFQQLNIRLPNVFSPFVAHMKKDARLCTNIQRLLQICDVCASLWTSMLPESRVRQEVIEVLLQLIGHDYPRVRGAAADHLYLVLTEDETNIEAAVHLQETEWCKDLEPCTIITNVGSLKALLNPGLNLESQG